MVEHKHIISYQQARDVCAGQEYAKSMPLEQKPTVRPSPEDETIVLCKARVAFQKTSESKYGVIGQPWPILDECAMSPNPNCEVCKVGQLSHELARHDRWIVKETMFEEDGIYVLLASAGLSMERE